MPQHSEEEVLERMAKGLVCTETEAASQDSRRRTEEIFEDNHTPPGRPERRRELIEAIFGSVGRDTVRRRPRGIRGA